MSEQKIRAKKFFIIAVNDRFPDNIQFNIITLLNTNDNLLINQYGKTFTLRDLGNFDIVKEGSFGILRFFPIDNRPNDYTYSFASFNFITEPLPESDAFISLGDLVRVGSTNLKRIDDFSKILELPSEYSSSKFDIQISIETTYQFDEINVARKNNEIVRTSYGTIFSGPLASSNNVGLGTYYEYVENDKIFVDFIPNSPGSLSNKEISFNVSAVSIANTNFSEEGDLALQNIVIESKKTNIEASIDPVPVGIGSHGFAYQASYYVVQCKDLTNNDIQLSEIVVINSRTQSYMIEFATISTSNDRIGVFSTLKSLDTELLFTPKENINVEVTLYQKKISSIVEFTDSSNVLDLDNFQILTGVSRSGTDGDSSTSFELKHKGIPIFERVFNGGNPSIVNLNDSTILIPNHFFVTGEKVQYMSDEFNPEDTSKSIGIFPTSIPDIGVIDKLPREVYIVKVDNSKIKLAKTAEDALKILPSTFNFTSLGDQITNKIVSYRQNSRSLISIDNVIQSPIYFTNKTTTLSNNIQIEDEVIYVDNEKLFSFGTLIQINSEIMRVTSVGIGSTNSLVVRRNILGSDRTLHDTSSLVNIIKGNYNIIDNKIYFTTAPYGLTPKPSIEDPLDEQDYNGLQFNASFDGRVFIRSGIPLTEDDTYYDNYIFDDISEDFDGVNREFILTSNGNSISGVNTSNNAIVLVNNIYQSPKGTQLSNVEGSYFLNDTLNDVTINFVGTTLSNPNDINTSGIPYGGVIVSVGSTEGFGYQPLISAGGTAIVSTSGTITDINIENIGSGYRVGIQTQVNVGVKTYGTGTPNIEFVGIASISDGSVTDVLIVNPGSGYTSSNPPQVVFDYPLGYKNIPLVYSSKSQPGIGTEATIDIVVGQEGSVIDFDILNHGYGYRPGDILTVPISENVGIPTFNTLFSEFQIIVSQIYNMDFSGWTMGQFEVLDSLDFRFNGRNKNFQITLEGKPISISKKKGSTLELEYVLLVFINDVLQIPFKDYTFTGSILKFKEPPRGSTLNPPDSGDFSKIIFYKGTRDIDVELVEVFDTPKVGDLLNIKSDIKKLSQRSRIIELISSVDTVDTNKYVNDGVSNDQNLLRPVKWCKQTEDLYIYGLPITKDRKIYEPFINPISYLIKDILITDTEIFVDSVKLFFDYNKENINSKDLNIIEVMAPNEENFSISSIFSGDGITSSNVITVTTTRSFSGLINEGDKISILNIPYTKEYNEYNGSFNVIEIVNPFTLKYLSLSQEIPENPTPDIFSGQGLLSLEVKYEKITDVVKYDGDYGLIVGIGSTSIVGIASTCLIFDFFIPLDSYLRNPELNVGTSLNGLSGIQTGHRFIISGTNIGEPNTSYDINYNIVGIGTTFIDNIYECIDHYVESKNVIGVGITDVTKVVASVNNYDGINEFGTILGTYSWGKITTPFRKNPKEFIINTPAITGLSTYPLIRRKNPLRYDLYLP
jgi:hypothetical protein